MTAVRPIVFAATPTPTPTQTFLAPHAPTVLLRTVHRARDFGVGYGRSSGYASSRRYTSDWAPPCFRFV